MTGILWLGMRGSVSRDSVHSETFPAMPITPKRAFVALLGIDRRQAFIAVLLTALLGIRIEVAAAVGQGRVGFVSPRVSEALGSACSLLPLLFRRQPAALPFRVGKGIEPIHSKNRAIHVERRVLISSPSPCAGIVSVHRTVRQVLIGPPGRHVRLACGLIGVIEFRGLIGMLLEVAEELGILADSHLVFIDKKCRQTEFLTLLINELPGGNFEHSIEGANVASLRPEEKPP